MTDPRPGEQQESEQTLTLDKAVRLLFLSFRYSQGEPITQDEIFCYLKARHPNWTVASSEELEKASEPMISKFINAAAGTQHLAQHNTRVAASITSEARDMVSRFDAEQQRMPMEIAHQILEELIEREGEYLEMGGRPLKDEDEHGPARVRPFSSQICKYGFLAQNAGMPEYNEMFKDITLAARELLLDNSVPADADRLRAIIEGHNLQNPRDKVTLPTP